MSQWSAEAKSPEGRKEFTKGLVVLLEIVGLEVTAKSIGTGTHSKADTH